MDEQTKVLSLVQEAVRLSVVLAEYAKTKSNAELAQAINKKITDFLNKNDTPEKFNKNIKDIFEATPKNKEMKEILKKHDMLETKKQVKEIEKGITKIKKQYGLKKTYKELIPFKKPKILEKLRDNLISKPKRFFQSRGSNEMRLTQLEQRMIEHVDKRLIEFAKTNQVLGNDIKEVTETKNEVKNIDKIREKDLINDLDKDIEKKTKEIKDEKAKAKVVEKTRTNHKKNSIANTVKKGVTKGK